MANIEKRARKSATLVTAKGEVELSVWQSEDSTDMLGVDEIVQPMPKKAGDDLLLPWGPGEARIQVQNVLEILNLLHLHAKALYFTKTGELRDNLLVSLSTMANASLQGLGRIPLDDILSAEEPSEGFGDEWHDELEDFIQICRQQIFVGVVVEESLYGRRLNVRASTLDTVTEKEVKLQAYWQDGDEEPVHWLAADDRTQPAHEDPELAEMLSGFGAGTRDHLRNALLLLHDPGDLADDRIGQGSPDGPHAHAPV